jgi:hypothetical protein
MPCSTVSPRPRRREAGRQFRDFDRARTAIRRTISIREARVPARFSPPSRTVSYSPGGRGTRRDGLARREPRLPGGFWQGNLLQRDLFFCTKPHRGRGEGTDRKDLGGAQNGPDPLVMKAALISSGRASELFSDSARNSLKSRAVDTRMARGRYQPDEPAREYRQNPRWRVGLVSSVHRWKSPNCIVNAISSPRREFFLVSSRNQAYARKCEAASGIAARAMAARSPPHVGT